MPQPSTQEQTKQTVVRRAGLVAVGTLASRVLGAGRDAVIAALFPVAATDLFWLAFTIPNALRGVLGEGAASGAFLPMLAETSKDGGEDATRAFLQRLQAWMSLVLVIVSVLGVLAAPWIVSLYASGFDGEARRQTIALTQWVFPYIAFMGVVAIWTAALHAKGLFGAPAFAPTALNAALILCALLLPPLLRSWGIPTVYALVVGVLCGGAWQVWVLGRAYAKAGYSFALRFRKDERIARVFKLLLPLLVGLGPYQLNVALSRNFASQLPEGAMSYLFYGQRLVEIPQGVFALAIGTASLPSLTAAILRGERAEAMSLWRGGLRLTLFVAIPSALVLAVFAEPIVATLLARGEFTAEDVVGTSHALMALAPGVIAIGLVRATIPMFYAFSDTRSPVIGAIVNLAVFASVTAALNESLGHVGVAIGISSAGFAQALVLFALLTRHERRLGVTEVLRSSSKTVLVSLAMLPVLLGIQSWATWRHGDGVHIALCALGLVVAAGTFAVVAELSRLQEWSELKGAFRRRRR